MSLVAKVFVILNLLLAVAFLIFAMNIWTAPAKYQRLYELEKRANVEALAAAAAAQIKMTRELATRDAQVEERKNNIAGLVLEKQKLLDEQLKLQEDIDRLTNAEQMLKAKEEEYVRENNRLKDDIIKRSGVMMKLNQAFAVATENAARYRNEKSEIESDLNSAKIQLAAMARDKRQVEDDLANNQRRLEVLIEKMPIGALLGEQVQPYIPDAQVLAVNPELGLVMLSVGSQQSVKSGYQFTLSRGDQYVGKVQVDKVYSDMCSARYVGPMMKQEPQVHDEARSR